MNGRNEVANTHFDQRKGSETKNWTRREEKFPTEGRRTEHRPECTSSLFNLVFIHAHKFISLHLSPWFLEEEAVIDTEMHKVRWRGGKVSEWVKGDEWMKMWGEKRKSVFSGKERSKNQCLGSAQLPFLAPLFECSSMFIRKKWRKKMNVRLEDGKINKTTQRWKLVLFWLLMWW